MKKSPYRPLSKRVRIAVLVAGWFLIVIGVAGLFLPFIQGILTLIAGLALVSVASQTVHRHLRERLRRWPRLWRRIEKLRRRLHLKLQPKEEA